MCRFDDRNQSLTIPQKTFSMLTKPAYINVQCQQVTGKQGLRIFLLQTWNLTKEDHLIIRKSKNRQCFKSVHAGKFVLQWVSKKIASMTTDILRSWRQKFSNKIRKRNRKIMLFLDNATSHSNISMRNVYLIFLPPSIYSVNLWIKA